MSDDSRSDHALSETLSARSYLELAQNHIQPEIVNSQSHDTPDSVVSEDPIEPEGNSGPRLRVRAKRPSLKEAKGANESEKPETSEIRDPPVERPMRKRGRPRLETTKDAAAIEGRRLQIRRAQRTYRQKKEATIQGLKTRVDVLEQTLQNVADILGAEQETHALTTVGSQGDSLTRARQLVMAEIHKTRSISGEHSQPDRSLASLRDIFGYHVSRTGRNTENVNTNQYDKTNSRYTRPYARSPSPLLNRLFPPTTIYTYSHQESNLSRRLQRFCLEHTYRWLTDPHADPSLMSRIFGLMPCIQDMPGVRRSIRRTLQSEIGGSLEANKMPFYSLGGAGTHYPRIGADGRPVYPVNFRRPGKILRRLSRILRRGGIQDWDEDWSGDAEPDLQDAIGLTERAMNDKDRLRSLDLEGEWYDCHDVQGYLESHGVMLDGSSLWLEVPATTVGVLYGFSPEGLTSHYYMSSEGTSPIDMNGTEYLNQSTYVLDVECFFDRESGPPSNFPMMHTLTETVLLANFRILGRAPGFKLWNVDAALRTAIHRRPFT
ncbi:hypothetical protein N7476_003259 [Penicillium atrosanguineum]|uniref:BZIP domain-containing protein n=1 Tax=Penicillium atrosanguineum TaxID=1132637 RepID=A0A9W9Q5C0_9EURO|nr:hypothetical protein N7526_004881 [Penicillium atrosanguineum]KAJ5324659.1 hypothetical protein N7476_003259 [Penicillium atrosanguineum]